MDDLIPGTEDINSKNIESKLMKLVGENSKDQLLQAEEMIDSLSDDINAQVPRFSISHFEKHFLTFFLTGKFTEAAVDAWIKNVAHTPLSPVHLINDVGEVVVTVPALVNSSDIDPEPNDNLVDTISAKSESAALEGSVIPMKGVMQLKNALSEHLRQKVRRSALTEAFFNYYKDWKPEGVTDEIERNEPEKFDHNSMFE